MTRRISYHVIDHTADIEAGDTLAAVLKAGGFTVYEIREAREGRTGECARHGDGPRHAICQRWTLFVERQGRMTEAEMLAASDPVWFMVWDSREPRQREEARV